MNKKFGKYELIERIGKGGMAEVFLARSVGAEGIEKQLVIKRILPELATNRRFIEMFIAEAKIAMGLNHPNVVQIYDFGKVEGDYYLAMEFVDGAELGRLLHASQEVGAPLPIGDAIYLAMEIARGLDYAHRRRDSLGRDLGLVHRDISPENLMVSWDGTVKIVDFGIARASSVAEESPRELKGKYQYMSPEQAAGKPVDHRSDIFSLGAVLFEMVCGRPLFRGDSTEENLSLVTSAVVPEIQTLNPEVPSPLEHAIYKALARRPDERFENARDLQIELTRVLYSLADIHDATTVSEHLALVKEKLPEDTLERILAGGGDADRSETASTHVDDTPTKELELDPRDHTPTTQEMSAASRELTPPRRRGVTPTLDEAPKWMGAGGGISKQRKEVVILTGEVDGVESEDEPGRPGQIAAEYRRIVDSIAYKNDAVIHSIDNRGFVLLLGIPISDESDAERAVRIAFDLEDAMSGMSFGLDSPLTVRIALTVGDVILGEVVEGDGRHYEWSLKRNTQYDAGAVLQQSESGEIVGDSQVYRRVRRSFVCRLVDDDRLPNDTRDEVYRIDGMKSGSDQIRELRRSFQSFYGREIPRRLLRGTFRRALLEERARGVIFVGRAGTGKSTLVEHFLSGLNPREVRVVRGVASPFDRDVPLASAAAFFGEMMRLDLDKEPEAIRQILDEVVDHLFAEDSTLVQQRIMESLYHLFDVALPGNELSELDGQERRQRLFVSLSRITNRLASERPLVLAIDDAHHIDPVMLAFAAEYFDRSQKAPVFFVGTSRASGPHMETRAWQELLNARHIKVEYLAELTTAQAEQMVRDLLEANDAASDALVEMVLERSGCNPLYIKEMVGALIDADMLSNIGEMEDLVENEELLPSSVEGLVRARIDRLDLEDRDALQRLSLLSSTFVEVDARAVLEGRPRAVLERLVGSGMLRKDGVNYSFVNGLTREMAARSLVPEEAKTLHRRIADHLLVERERHDSALIAWHFEAAGERGRALELYEAAIEEAFESFGAGQSLRLCDRVLANEEITPEQAFRVLKWKESALSEVGESSEIRETLERLEALVAQIDNPADRAHVAARRARFHYGEGEFERARKAASEALDIARSSGDRLGMVHAWRTEAIIDLAEGNRDRALGLIDRAIASLNVGGDRRAREAMVEIYSARGVILRQSGRHREALEAYETALAAANGLDSTKLTRQLLINSGLALVYLGEFSEAKRRYEKALDACRQLGHRRQEGLILVNLGHVYQTMGRHDRAERHIRRGMHLARRTDSDTTVTDGMVTLALSYLERKQWRKAEHWMRRGLEMAESIPHAYLEICARLGLVQVALESGDKERERDAIGQARHALKRSEEAGMMWGVAVAHSLLAAALDRAGESQEALRCSRRAVEMLDEVDILGIDQILISHAELLVSREGCEGERRRCIERAVEVFEHRRDKIDDDEDRQAFVERSLSRKITALRADVVLN